MKLIPRDLFDIAEDFDMGVYENPDGSFGIWGTFQGFSGFLADFSIRREQEGQAQIAFDLAKSVEFENDEDEGFYFFEFVGYQFQ